MALGQHLGQRKRSFTGISCERSRGSAAWIESASRIGCSTSSTNRVSPGSQPTVEIVVRRCVIPTSRQPQRRRLHLVEVEDRLAHPHEDEVVHRLDPPEVQHLVEDLRGAQVAAEPHRAVAQNVHVSGQPDCEETQIERRPSR